MNKVCILGAGSWGTAQAVLLAQNVAQVVIWGRPEDGIEEMNRQRQNQRFLPGVALPENIIASEDPAESLAGAELVVLAVPAQAMRQMLVRLGSFIPDDVPLVNTAKGLEIETGMRMSEVVLDVLGADNRSRYTVLSGPSHAEEVGRYIPTAVTLAAYEREAAFQVQNIYMTSRFRVYTNPDVAGVELGGALKNIVALATGICEGLGYGDNTRAALMTRGLAEMIRMGTAMGGDLRTFNGLSGVGDLIVTCGSQHSRNHRAGRLIASGCSLEQTLEQIGMAVEGIHTTRAVHRLAGEIGVDMPICQACYHVIHDKGSPASEVNQLMVRTKKNEIEEIVLHPENWK